MPRTKEQYEKNRNEKRKLLKDTALSLFAVNGYDATSIESIASSAGISKGLMYNYFASKEELLQAIWDELLTAFNEIVDVNADGEITDNEAEFFIDRFFEMCKNNRELWKIYYQLSFQPKVVKFLMTKYNSGKAQQKQKLIIDYFSKKLPHNDMQINYFTILVFLKGLSLVATYTENIFNNDFLDNYKNTLKSIFFNNKT